MMTLLTRSTAMEKGRCRVEWRTGIKTKGILDVIHDPLLADAEVISELVAIQHLLFTAKIHDRYPISGIGYKLVVSKGAIKKLIQRKSTKEHLIKYAAFLGLSMHGVEVVVSKNLDGLDKDFDEVEAVESVTLDPSIHGQMHCLVEAAFADVYVTTHAVDKYELEMSRRVNESPLTKPWSSLIKRLQSSAIMKVQLPSSVLKHKARKYGTSDNVEVWKNPVSNIHFLVIKENTKRTLVTTFARAEFD
ncbi:hypothetical protein [Shewanella sp. MBTL60-007]|uniref:hypothetical protein n=1 Tax=Shewanella sp. MBTL60-007 TaxID=2815911 RepID=UPI001C7E37A4|nr:hypothetical protein [Shewanella sp. MBTL60-007]